jgi:hypothetical protein
MSRKGPHSSSASIIYKGAHKWTTQWNKKLWEALTTYFPLIWHWWIQQFFYCCIFFVVGMCLSNPCLATIGGYTYLYIQQTDLINLLLFFQNREIMLKIHEVGFHYNCGLIISIGTHLHLQHGVHGKLGFTQENFRRHIFTLLLRKLNKGGYRGLKCK